MNIDESQVQMNVLSTAKSRRLRKSMALVVLTGLCGSSARAQQNPFRAVTDAMGLTTEAGPGADFVRQSRPDLNKLDYSGLSGVDKKRVPVRTPAEVEADKADLIASREKANTQLKKLGAEKVTPVAPTKAPPRTDF